MNNKCCSFVVSLLGTILVLTPLSTFAHEKPIIESTQLETTYSEQGVVKWKVFTGKALQYENGDWAYPEGIYIEFFQEDEQLSATGRANSAFFSAEKQVYKFRGDVELRNLIDSRQLNTEELYWNPKTEEIYTDKFFRMESEDERMLTGQRLSAKQDFSHYHIVKPQGLLNIQPIK